MYVTVTVIGGLSPYCKREDVLPNTPTLITIFATSAARAEVCGLLSAVLVSGDHIVDVMCRNV